MKVVLQWEKPNMEWDCVKEKEMPSKYDRQTICLSVGIIGLSEKESYNFLDTLENEINKNLEKTYGKTSFLRCSSYEDIKEKSLYDTLTWKRDFGCVSKQKENITKTIRECVKNLKEEKWSVKNGKM